MTILARAGVPGLVLWGLLVASGSIMLTRAVLTARPCRRRSCILPEEWNSQNAGRPSQAGPKLPGEGQTVLNGSRLLTTFSREARYWIASRQEQRGQRHGRCAKEAPACDLPESLFIDDKPLSQLLSKESVETGRFYLDHASGRLYFADDPTAHKVEVTVAAFAFESAAPNVLIRNVIVEKYASVAQKGAIQSKGAAGWIVENCEVRLNSGTGIVIQAGGRVRGCDVHHNGQMGIGGRGKDILHGTGTPEPGAEGPTGLLHCCINQLASIPTIVKREALKGDVISSACGDRGRVGRKSHRPIGSANQTGCGHGEHVSRRH